MVYNRNRHLELLKLDEDFKNLGKVFHREDWENFLELMDYSAAISEYVQWENRFEFVSLLEDFLNETISREELSHKFYLFNQKLINLTRKLRLELNSEKFEDFNPDSLRLIGFGAFLGFLGDELDNNEEGYENKEFYRAVKELFLDVQKLLDSAVGVEEKFNKDEI